MNLDTLGLINLVMKLFFIISSLIYLFFAGVVVRQVQAMTSKVKDMFNSIIQLISWIHLVFAILLVLSTLLL
jgi:p-aminobenzoyl-glutamate transporter AbgT